MELLKKIFYLIFSFDRDIYQIVLTSLGLTFFSILFATVIAVPLAFIIDFSNYKIKKFLIAFINSLTSLPTVVIGLIVYSFISRKGFLGFTGLLFTPGAIIIGQTILAIPIITSTIIAGFSKIDSKLYETLKTLGADKYQVFLGIISETKILISTALLGGFGRIIGEVGVSMMLGGNIKRYTRTMTTAIALETSKGEFEFALSLGIILLLIALSINFIIHLFLKREDKWKQI